MKTCPVCGRIAFGDAPRDLATDCFCGWPLEAAALGIPAERLVPMRARAAQGIFRKERDRGLVCRELDLGAISVKPGELTVRQFPVAFLFRPEALVLYEGSCAGVVLNSFKIGLVEQLAHPAPLELLTTIELACDTANAGQMITLEMIGAAEASFSLRLRGSSYQ